MRSILFAKSYLCLLTLTAGGLAVSAELKTDKEKISFIIGHQIGSNLKRDGIDVDFNVMQAAIKDGLAGTPSSITQEEAQKLMQGLQAQLKGQAEAKAKVAGEKNVADGKKFLADNAKKSGVKKTASGLQYKVMTEGKGEAPKATDTVKVNYRGTLLDGSEFDSSYGRGQPATFPVNGVIKGWTEALQLMKPGAKYQLWIPAELAYGERGTGDKIGPNATLSFEVELLAIEKPAEKAPAK